MNIQEDYVSFETAKLLKEKGFDECPLFRYDDCGELWVQGGYNKTIKWHFPAPTLQMTMKWLRKEHNLFIEPYVVKNYSKKKLEYTYSIQDLDFQGSDDGIECCKNWDTPERACEAAIKYCLENLI